MARCRSTRPLQAALLLLFVAASSSFPKMKTIYSWKALDFDFPSPEERQMAIDSGQFNYGRPLPIDVEYYPKGKDESKVFITVPRFQAGVPVTLGYVTNKTSPAGDILIAPYPDWEWNRLGNCDGITSVYRIQIDRCDRLWVLDTGKLEEAQVCQPQILSFDLRNDKLLSRYRFPPSQYREESLYVTPAVDVRGTDDLCEDTFVYIADVTGFALIVYDHRNARSWKITNNLFYPHPLDGTFEIKGDSFDLMDGILGLALSPTTINGDRILYFHPLASRVEARVPTSIIRNYTIFADEPEAKAREFVAFAMRRSSQAVAQTMNRHGILFFGLVSDLAVGCWNSRHYPEYGGANLDIVVKDPVLQFISGIKLTTPKETGREELWLIAPSFQKFMVGKLHSKETNFRIQAGYVDEIVHGSKCDVNALSVRGSRLNKISTPYAK